jgi:hypothetical protein
MLTAKLAWFVQEKNTLLGLVALRRVFSHESFTVQYCNFKFRFGKVISDSYAGTRQVSTGPLSPSLLLFYLSCARMVDYHNPITTEREFCAYAFLQASATSSPIYQSVPSIVALVKLWHLADGIFM